MKIIFSRKGIDSAYGKGVSPIFPNGYMLSIPIPVKGKEKGIHYTKMRFNGQSIKSYMKQLNLRINQSTCHCDPYINANVTVKERSWIPSFGSHGAAASHLINEEVSIGDLFLFFGTFQKVKREDSKWCFDRKNKPLHVLFGFMLVDQILKMNKKQDKKDAAKLGLQDHPHFVNEYPVNNILFIGDKDKSGMFTFNEKLILSHNGKTKSIWKVPSFFDECEISRNRNKSRFTKQKDFVLWKTVSIGQEFVCQPNQQLTTWASQLIESHQA